jgi:hypothetical protein
MSAAPRLALGGTPLLTGSQSYTLDFKRLPFQALSSESEGRFRGILGMDCLRHYCIQLDFGNGRRLTDSPGPNLPHAGHAFPLVFGPSLEGKSESALPFCYHENSSEDQALTC